jgi:hypothetical protein
VTAEYIAQVTFQDVSGLSKDRMENVFHFVGALEPSVADGSAIIGRLADFYLTAPATGGAALAAFLARAIDNAVTIKVYDENAAHPRPILVQGGFTLPVRGTTQDMPESTAVVLSYYSGRNLPRLRGRVFLGPLSGNAAEMDANPRPYSGLLTAIQAGATRLVNNDDGTVAYAESTYFNALGISEDIDATTTAAPVCNWAVRSGLGAGTWKQVKGVGAGTKIVTYTLVTAGFINNAWHVQRRREVEASARVTF